MSINLNASIPGSDVEYYVASVDFTKYIPNSSAAGSSGSTASSRSATQYGETTSMPPYRNRYGGGPGSVRGFKES